MVVKMLFRVIDVVIAGYLSGNKGKLWRIFWLALYRVKEHMAGRVIYFRHLNNE